MAVEKELIALRKDYKISQKQISKAIGLSEEQYRRKELGQYDWRATEMFAIRNYLKPFIGPRSLNDIFYDKTTQNVYKASQKGFKNESINYNHTKRKQRPSSKRS